MRRMFLEVLCAVLLGLVQVTAYAQTQKSPERPSLDALRGRAEAYWALLVKRQKVEAASFVETASRQNFNTRQEPDFSDPQISKIEFTSNPQEATVTFLIKRKVPPIQNPLDWPVQEKWVYREGQWYVEIPKSMSILGIAPGSGVRPAASPEELEKMRDGVRKRLVFRTSALEFGTVRKGATAEVTLEYTYRGDAQLQFKLRDAPPNLQILTPAKEAVAGAGSAKPRLALRTQSMAGEVNLSFTLLAREGEVEVPYPLKIHGFVYTPVSFAPEVLRYVSGETEKELEVQNNTKAEVRLTSFYSQSEVLQLKGLPKSLLPGEKYKLKLIVTKPSARPNVSEELDIRLSEPAEGLASLRIFVIRNYVPQAKPKPTMPSRKALDEHLQKTRPEQRTKQ